MSALVKALADCAADLLEEVNLAQRKVLDIRFQLSDVVIGYLRAKTGVTLGSVVTLDNGEEYIVTRMETSLSSVNIFGAPRKKSGDWSKQERFLGYSSGEYHSKVFDTCFNLRGGE